MSQHTPRPMTPEQAFGTILNLRPWSNRAPFRQVGEFLDGDESALDQFPSVKRDVMAARAAITKAAIDGVVSAPVKPTDAEFAWAVKMAQKATS